MSNEIEKAAKARIAKTFTKELAGIEYEFRYPSTAQFLITAGAINEAETNPMSLMPEVKKLIQRSSIDKKQAKEIWGRIEDGEIDLDEILLDDDSLFMEMSEVMSAGRPTGPSSDSSESSTAQPGKRSTGRSRGKGSIH